MRPAGATFWRLGGLSGWQRQTASSGLAVSDRHGLRLAAAPGGPLSLEWEDGSFGGLTLPRGFAFDDRLTLYLLTSGGTVKRYDGESRAFIPFAHFGGATNIAIARGWLYVAIPDQRRVTVVDLVRSVVVDVLQVNGWEPVDLASHKSAVYVLDAKNGRVYRHAPYERLELELERADRAAQWSRVTVDRDGTLVLLNQFVLERRDPDSPPITDPGAIRDLFDPPLVRLDEMGRFRLSASLAGVCGRRMPEKGRSAVDGRWSAGEGQRESPVAARGDFLLYVVRRAERRVDAYTDDGRRLRHSWRASARMEEPLTRPPATLSPLARGEGARNVLSREILLPACGEKVREARMRGCVNRALARAEVPSGACMDWQPCDVAACSDTAFILDEKYQAVYRHSAGREQLKELFRDETANRNWSRIACDGDSLFLYRAGAENVQVFDCAGNPRCDRPYVDVKALFEKERPEPPASIEGGLLFDREGNATARGSDEPNKHYLYEKSGQWQSKPLDSDIYRCQWHRIELSLSSFPPGSRITVSTCAHTEESDVNDAMKSQFVDAQTVVAPISGAPTAFDFLVQSGLGRYMTIRIRIEGDGFTTPEIDSAKIHYPRESYLEYLPATYSADDEMRIFLERFLSIFQTEWDEVDRDIDEIERFFDPDAVPEGAFLEQLAAQWLGLPLEGDWSGEQKRRLLSAAPKIYPRRGQLSGLRDFIAVYLANMSGLETEDVQELEYPVIVEGFREREFLFGSSGDASQLGAGAPLWSASVKRRLQLGVYATEGEAELVSVGDPERDVFAHYAHRFRVYVPAAWVRTESQERMIRRALDAEKPAHTQYDLCLIEPRFRIGAQSTVGVDTVLGIAPSIRLRCPSCTDAAPSLPPAGRLGYDTVLSTDTRAAVDLVLA